MSWKVLAIDDDPAILRGYNNLFNVESALGPLLDLYEGDMGEVQEHDEFLRQVNLDITSSGESGFEMVRDSIEQNRPYAVIYLDMRMPGKWDGIETARDTIN